MLFVKAAALTALILCVVLGVLAVCDTLMQD